MRKNGVQRCTAIMLSFLMGLSLVGCNSQEKTTGSEGTSASEGTKADSQSEASAKTEDSILNKPGQLPIVKEPLTLTIFAPSNGEFSYADNAETKEIEEQTGIKINWQIAASSDDIKTKVSTIFASGDMPDIIFTNVGASNRFDKASEQSFGMQGLVIPLNQYLDTVSVGYKQAFNDVQGMRDFITTPDGNIYSLPNLDGSLHIQYPMKAWINTKWLDNLGLEMPQTTEEFEAVLKAFKEKDANGNGDPNDEIPLSRNTEGNGVEFDGFLMAPYQLTPVNKMYLDNGAVKYAPTEEKYKEGLKWLHKMYEEGLIYPESFTQDLETQVNINEGGDEAKIGCFLGGRPGYACDLKTYPNNSKRWEEYQPLAPLEGPDGTKQAVWNPYVQFQTGMTFITSSCEHPEAAFRLLDYLATEKMAMRSAIGVEGVDWRAAKEGELGLDGTPALYTRLDTDTTNKNWTQLACLVRQTKFVNGQTVNQDPYGEGVRPLDGRQILLYKASIEQQKCEQPFESVLPDLFMSEEDAAEMALIKTTIADTQIQLMTQFITGSLDIDSGWDSYISQLKNAGLDRYIELWQTAYDSSIYAQ